MCFAVSQIYETNYVQHFLSSLLIFRLLNEVVFLIRNLSFLLYVVENGRGLPILLAFKAIPQLFVALKHTELRLPKSPGVKKALLLGCKATPKLFLEDIFLVELLLNATPHISQGRKGENG